MKNKLYFLLIIFLMTFQLLSQEKKILWDLGVVINSPTKNINISSKIKQNKGNVYEGANGKALISNSFVSPIIKSNEKKIIKLKENFDLFPKNDINKIKLIITRLTIKNLYQPIIEIINEMNFDDFKHDELQEINYWLANAFLNTGQYEMAENVLLNNSKNRIDDKSNFLLATIFEHQNKTKKAQKEYLNFIKKYPNSDYKMSALIKAKMLD